MSAPVIALSTILVALAAALTAVFALMRRASDVRDRNIAENDVEYLRRAREERSRAEVRGQGGMATSSPSRARARAIMAAGALACAALAYALTRNVPLALAALLASALGQRSYARARERRREELFSDQLAEALPQVAENMRAGLTPERAVRAVAEHAEEPLAGELRRVTLEMAYGSHVSEAFAAMADRTGSPDVRAVANAMAFARETGGSLSSVLESVATTIERKASMRRHVLSITASARTSRLIVAAVPWAVLVAWMLMNAQAQEFYATAAGALSILAVVVLEAVGLAVMARQADMRIG